MKPTTRFIRRKSPKEHFNDLVISYRCLQDLCELFDKGRTYVASLIAVEIAKLVGSEGRDQSPILFRFKGASDFHFSKTRDMFGLPAEAVILGKFNALASDSFRTIHDENTVTLVRSSVPRCWEALRRDTWIEWETAPFENWWTQQVVMSERNTVRADGSPKPPYKFSRRGLVKAVRDAQGAHSRDALREDEQPLTDLDTSTVSANYSGPLREGQRVMYGYEILPTAAAVRQIAEELLSTIGRLSSAGLLQED
jgi:hypothetical protein